MSLIIDSIDWIPRDQCETKTGFYLTSPVHSLSHSDRLRAVLFLIALFQVSLHDVSRTSPNDNGIGASFLLGHAGIYAVSALVFNALGL